MITSQKFWDKTAPKYAKQPVKNVTAYEETLNRTRDFLTPRDTVLELGCGTGTTALKLSDAVAHITGSDISGAMVEIANQKAEEQGAANVDFFQTDAFAAEMEEEFYDAVLAYNLLHLLPDPVGVARRVNDLLKPGGYFISKTVCIGGSFLWPPIIKLMQVLGIAPFVHYMKPRDVEAVLESAGFEIVEARSFTNAPKSWFVVARKAQTH